jgi:RNA polymerase sigma-70 factor (ECF subfamily)
MLSDVRADTAAAAEELALVAAVRAGDERAFATLLERHYGAMLALAKAYGPPPGAAEQAVHGACMTALAASAEFDGGTPLRTWLLRFAARAAAPLATAGDGGRADTSTPAVDPERFRGRADAFSGHWRAYPRDWRTLPADVVRGADTRRVIEHAIAALPVDQRTAITLRDVLGCPTAQACAVLGRSEAAVRRSLHQARSHVRAVLERHFDA